MFNAATGHAVECLCNDCILRAIDLVMTGQPTGPEKSICKDITEAVGGGRIIKCVVDDSVRTKDGAA